jgi:hypothetical protein
MEATELAAHVKTLGGIRAVARALQCSPASIANYCAGLGGNRHVLPDGRCVAAGTRAPLPCRQVGRRGTLRADEYLRASDRELRYQVLMRGRGASDGGRDDE